MASEGKTAHTEEFEILDGVLQRYHGEQTEAVVPEGVLTLAGSRLARTVYDANSDRYIPVWTAGAFGGNQTLQSVRLPSTLRTIGREAFAGCAALTSLALPERVTQIGAGAFADTALRQIVLPEGVTEIEEGTFHGCAQLASVTLPDSLLRIGARAFKDCGALTRLDLPGHLAEIGDGAFDDCTGLQSLRIPDSVQRLEGCICRGCRSLETVLLPAGLPERALSRSQWYVLRKLKAGCCPVCGEPNSPRGECGNLNCPTQYGKWER